MFLFGVFTVQVNKKKLLRLEDRECVCSQTESKILRLVESNIPSIQCQYQHKIHGRSMKILSVQSRHFWFCDQLIFSTLSGLESFREGNKEMSETRSLSQTINKNKRRVKNVCYRSSNWLKEQLKNVANKERWFTINRGVKMIHVVTFLLPNFI